ncbi:MAG: hypothetical protein FJ308_00705 [Planctomycetes bacterium]|nr:hypothetical protein [Planctomycetota bacterium]
MTEQEFLQHHQLVRNPFVDEDAQTDTVFRDFCISGTFHPSWSKVVGDAKQPATAIVFGAKGSGKTAMRLQLIDHIESHNQSHPDQKVFLICYDDFNAYLGPFEEHLPRRSRNHPERVLSSLRLWDHMDAMLSEGITQLLDRLLTVPLLSNSQASVSQRDPISIDRLDRGQKRDLTLLAAMYDRSKSGNLQDRVHALRRKLRFWSWSTWFPSITGCLLSIFATWALYSLVQNEAVTLKTAIIAAPIAALVAWGWYGSLWFRRHWLASRICKNLRVLNRDSGQLRPLLLEFTSKEIDEQPAPQSQRSDDRYALLEKLQLLLRTVGYPGLIVIIDRVDEPDLVNGQAERMKQLVWPLMDNKLLKHENLGIKMLLPSDLQPFAERETREFNERARLDKQNVVASFDWTGEALYDLLGARMKACAISGTTPSPQKFFSNEISDARFVAALQSLRTPRNVFRFLYQLIAEHCKRFRSESPSFQISSELFESTLALYQAEDRRKN